MPGLQVGAEVVEPDEVPVQRGSFLKSRRYGIIKQFKVGCFSPQGAINITTIRDRCSQVASYPLTSGKLIL